MTAPHRRVSDLQRTQVRADQHRAVDINSDAWAWISEQANGRGYPHGGDLDSAGTGQTMKIFNDDGDIIDTVPASSVETAALTTDPFADWILEYAEARAAQIRCANMALALAPATPQRGRVNDVRLCVKCGQPIPDKVHLVDQQPLCATTCYSQLWRKALKEGTTIGALVASLVKDARSRERGQPGNRHKDDLT